MELDFHPPPFTHTPQSCPTVALPPPNPSHYPCSPCHPQLEFPWSQSCPFWLVFNLIKYCQKACHLMGTFVCWIQDKRNEHLCEREGQRGMERDKERREWAWTEWSDKPENERQIEGEKNFPVYFSASYITSAPLRRKHISPFSVKPYMVKLKGRASWAAMSRSQQWL